jgi:hypothetical protein
VLILTIILDGAGQLAPDRYSLFWGYYETVFKRERDKQGGLHHMLREYGQQLHERVGFELQVRSESGDRSYATLTSEELKQITWQVLDEAGFRPSGKDAGLLDSIFAAATQRAGAYRPPRQRRLRVRRALPSGTHGCHAPDVRPAQRGHQTPAAGHSQPALAQYMDLRCWTIVRDSTKPPTRGCGQSDRVC